MAINIGNVQSVQGTWGFGYGFNLETTDRHPLKVMTLVFETMEDAARAREQIVTATQHAIRAEIAP